MDKLLSKQKLKPKVKPELSIHIRPVRNQEWVESDGGTITLLVPKFRGKRIGSWLMKRLKNPYYKIKLDEFGSFVWQLCNGERTVSRIAACLDEKFGAQVDPALPRLQLFLDKLQKNNLIRYMVNGNFNTGGNTKNKES